MVAERASVTPSTIYRRWGTLDTLLSDVATENLRPEQPPEDRGCFEDDLLAWAEAFYEEMSSPSGRSMVRDVLSGGDHNAGTCSEYAAEQVDIMLRRAELRGEAVPSREEVLDAIVAPLIYRILFRPQYPVNVPMLVSNFIEGLARQ